MAGSIRNGALIDSSDLHTKWPRCLLVGICNVLSGGHALTYRRARSVMDTPDMASSTASLLEASCGLSLAEADLKRENRPDAAI